eukprot:scaffold766_cov179-Amphora_coffeaeformis.AAC.12
MSAHCVFDSARSLVQQGSMTTKNVARFVTDSPRFVTDSPRFVTDTRFVTDSTRFVTDSTRFVTAGRARERVTRSPPPIGPELFITTVNLGEGLQPELSIFLSAVLRFLLTS